MGPTFLAEERVSEHLAEALKTPTPLAHAVQSRVMATQGLYARAVTEAKKAVALDGNDASAHAGLASALNLAGRHAEGLTAIQKAMRLDPHYPPSYLITLGAAQFGMVRYADAAATFERAVKRNLDNELPVLYLAASYGHLGRIKDGDVVIEAANELRHKAGLEDLNLERYDLPFQSPFEGGFDYERFGGRPVQERARAGLSKLSSFQWRKFITYSYVQATSYFNWEIEGATRIDAATAKSLYDRGVTLINTSLPSVWEAGHIPGTVNLPQRRPNDPARKRLNEATLQEFVDKDEEVVFYGGTIDIVGKSTPLACAKAVAWGFTRVNYFAGGLKAWNKAGYPVGTAQ